MKLITLLSILLFDPQFFNFLSFTFFILFWVGFIIPHRRRGDGRSDSDAWRAPFLMGPKSNTIIIILKQKARNKVGILIFICPITQLLLHSDFLSPPPPKISIPLLLLSLSLKFSAPLSVLLLFPHYFPSSLKTCNFSKLNTL